VWPKRYREKPNLEAVKRHPCDNCGYDVDGNVNGTTLRWRLYIPRRKCSQMADLKKRATVYGIQYNRMKERILCFIEENKYANRKGWGVPEVSSYHIRWVEFMERYLMNGDTLAMPKNWAKSEVFPVCNIATLGNAGSGKTRSMIDIHATQPDFTVTGPVNKSTDAYTAALMHSTQPQSRRDKLHWNTFH
jgi:hypothetical protein